MLSKLKYSFTLIEMLIVIVIIGILAAALVPRLQSVQGRARDSKRKVDLRTIYNANEIYKTDYSLYPTGGANNNFFSTDAAPWISPLSGILTSLPTDPINTTGSYTGSWPSGPRYTGAYVYRYGNVLNNSQTYDLTAQLENANDPDRCEAKRRSYYWPLIDCMFAVTGTGLPAYRKGYEVSPDSL